MKKSKGKAEYTPRCHPADILADFGIEMKTFDMFVEKDTLKVSVSEFVIDGSSLKFEAMSRKLEIGDDIWVVIDKGKLQISEQGVGVALGRVYYQGGQWMGWKRVKRVRSNG